MSSMHDSTRQHLFFHWRKSSSLKWPISCTWWPHFCDHFVSDSWYFLDLYTAAAHLCTTFCACADLLRCFMSDFEQCSDNKCMVMVQKSEQTAFFARFYRLWKSSRWGKRLGDTLFHIPHAETLKHVLAVTFFCTMLHKVHSSEQLQVHHIYILNSGK